MNVKTLGQRVERLEKVEVAKKMMVAIVNVPPGNVFKINNRAYSAAEFEVFRAELPKNVEVLVVEVGAVGNRR